VDQPFRVTGAGEHPALRRSNTERVQRGGDRFAAEFANHSPYATQRAASGGSLAAMGWGFFNGLTSGGGGGGDRGSRQR